MSAPFRSSYIQCMGHIHTQATCFSDIFCAKFKRSAKFHIKILLKIQRNMKHRVCQFLQRTYCTCTFLNFAKIAKVGFSYFHAFATDSSETTHLLNLVLLHDLHVQKYETGHCQSGLWVHHQHRKRPCISRTFFHKIEDKNQGCSLSTDTAVFGVLKNLTNIHNTS